MFPQRLKPVYARFFVGPKGPTPGAKIGWAGEPRRFCHGAGGATGFDKIGGGGL